MRFQIAVPRPPPPPLWILLTPLLIPPSHICQEYESIHHGAEADLRALLAVPANYKILFLQGGAHLQARTGQGGGRGGGRGGRLPAAVARPF